MRITLAAVGKMKASPERDLLQKYCKQLPWPVTVKEIDIKKSLPTEQRKRAEAEQLLEACSGAHVLVALDEHGKNLSSEELASKFSGWQQDSSSHIALIIGGQDGLDESVRQRCNLLLSFGKLTWPHMMVRSMLGEQLYRVHTILSGHPYHRS